MLKVKRPPNKTKQKETQDLLNSATVKLNSCLEDRASATARVEAMKDQLEDLNELIESSK